MCTRSTSARACATTRCRSILIATAGRSPSSRARWHAAFRCSPCRGFQEANVALGGSLHQAVHEVPGQHDHRAAADASPEVTYGLAHPVDVMPGGTLERILGQRRFEVNSVHGQGVNRLAPGLRVEARAPDGLVEAFSFPKSPAFNLCVQWHPEWQAASNPVSMRLFQAFGAACQSYRDRHRATQSEGVPDR
jgi:putative glutamine amidotransferase